MGYPSPCRRYGPIWLRYQRFSLLRSRVRAHYCGLYNHLNFMFTGLRLNTFSIRL